MSLPKINKTNIADQAFNAIHENIVNGTWKTGTKMPSENELCELMGISRVSVRSAIQKLVTIGLLDARQGEGTFIKEFSLKDYFAQVAPLVFTGKNYLETVQFRYAIESACAKFAIDIYDSVEIEKLENLCIISEKAYNKGKMKEYLSLDLQFHRQLCKMSGNGIFLMVFDSFSMVFFNTSQTNLEIVMKAEKIQHKDSYSHHMALVEAIKAKDYSKTQYLVHKIILKGSTPQD